MDVTFGIETVFLVLYILLIVSTMFITLASDWVRFSRTPRQIYDTSDLNMFGCVLLWIFSIVTNPIGYLMFFIHFLFHVGRKHEEEDEWYGL